MRSDKVKQLLGQVYEIINTLHPSKNSALDRAVTYALNQKEKLYLFLTHPEIEMTNNLAERTVNGKGRVKVVHYIQSFSPDENITPEQAHRIAKAFVRKTFGDFRVAFLATSSYIMQHRPFLFSIPQVWIQFQAK